MCVYEYIQVIKVGQGNNQIIIQTFKDYYKVIGDTTKIYVK